jgi:hypothetical protein
VPPYNNGKTVSLLFVLLPLYAAALLSLAVPVFFSQQHTTQQHPRTRLLPQAFGWIGFFCEAMFI